MFKDKVYNRMENVKVIYKTIVVQKAIDDRIVFNNDCSVVKKDPFSYGFRDDLWITRTIVLNKTLKLECINNPLFRGPKYYFSLVDSGLNLSFTLVMVPCNHLGIFVTRDSKIAAKELCFVIMNTGYLGLLKVGFDLQLIL